MCSVFLIFCFNSGGGIWVEELDLKLELEAIVELQLRSAASLLGLPLPVRLDEEIGFGCAVGFGEAAAVERRKNIEPTLNPNVGSGGDNTNRGV